MPEYLLAGVVHGKSTPGAKKPDEIASGPSLAHFQARVTPLITDSTLMLLEGQKTPGLIDRKHRNYAQCVARFGSLIGRARPTFAFVDARNPTQTEGVRRFNMHTEWLRIGFRKFVVKETAMPKTLEELIERVHMLPQIRMTETLDKHEHELANWMLIRNRRFDRDHIAAMRLYGSRFERVIFVGGLSHAISIHNQTNFPLMILHTELTEEVLKGIFGGYLAGYVFPKIALQLEEVS